MRAWMFTACALLLAGCAGVPLPGRLPPDLLPEADAAPSAVPVDAAAALALSPAMRDYLRERIAPLVRLHGPREALTRALFDRRQLQLAYDAGPTRTAAEAFDARAGNCLSLVLMTSALAHALDLHVSYQQVDSESAWRRSGDLLAYSGHVNLVLGGGGARKGAGARWDTQMVIDFLPPQDLYGHVTTPISEATVLGMYLNNRAAEALAAGRPDEAYAWVRAALQQAPRLVPAWNTLGLVHRRRGDESRAERTWAQALAAEPDNTRVLANLIGLLQAQSRAAEAAPLRARLARLEPVAPYAWFEQGVQALRQGRWAAAREAFTAELARDPDQPEAHAGMAQAEAQLGDVAAARRHLVLARENSATPQQQALYAAKLARLGGTAGPVN